MRLASSDRTARGHMERHQFVRIAVHVLTVNRKLEWPESFHLKQALTREVVQGKTYLGFPEDPTVYLCIPPYYPPSFEEDERQLVLELDLEEPERIFHSVFVRFRRMLWLRRVLAHTRNVLANSPEVRRVEHYYILIARGGNVMLAEKAAWWPWSALFRICFRKGDTSPSDWPEGLSD